jgi:DNA (cytosine-5)-methyltransferase 1
VSPIAYYNEIDPYAAQWLRNLIAAKLIMDGHVDERSIVDIEPSDLDGFTRCHFFAGIAGWDLGLQYAGWPADRPVWTGSCPCQPFSQAGIGGGFDDPRHLWPHWIRLIRECRPPELFGEQVAAPDGYAWLDAVLLDLEEANYAVGAAVIPAAGVGAPHGRHRIWFVADASGREQRRPRELGESTRRRKLPNRGRRSGGTGRPADTGRVGRVVGGRASGQDQGPQSPDAGGMGHADSDGWPEGREAAETSGHGHAVVAASWPAGVALVDASSAGFPVGSIAADGRGSLRHEGPTSGAPSPGGFWDRCEWLPFRDGKLRPVEPGLSPLASGLSGRVAVRGPVGQGGSENQEEHWINRIGAIKAFGNSIVPQAAAEFIGAYLDCRP